MRESPLRFITLHLRTTVLVTMCLTALVACGSRPQAHAPATAATKTPSKAALNGCLEQPGQATMPQDAADVVLTQHDPSAPSFVQAVTVYIGQIIEVRLPTTIYWALAPHDVDIVADAPPQSLLDVTDQVCVWRFVAKQIGTTPLNFSGGLVCAPDQACPAIAAIKQYAITVLARQ